MRNGLAAALAFVPCASTPEGSAAAAPSAAILPRNPRRGGQHAHDSALGRSCVVGSWAFCASPKIIVSSFVERAGVWSHYICPGETARAGRGHEETSHRRRRGARAG